MNEFEWIDDSTFQRERYRARLGPCMNATVWWQSGDWFCEVVLAGIDYRNAMETKESAMTWCILFARAILKNWSDKINEMELVDKETLI